MHALMISSSALYPSLAFTAFCYYSLLVERMVLLNANTRHPCPLPLFQTMPSLHILSSFSFGVLSIFLLFSYLHSFSFTFFLTFVQHSLIHPSLLPAHHLPPSCCSLLHFPPPRSHPYTLSLALSPTPSLPMSSFPLHILSNYLHFRPTIYHHRYLFSVLFLSCRSPHAGR